jgi:C4-dicarboxylate transporter DctM subunit
MGNNTVDKDLVQVVDPTIRDIPIDALGRAAEALKKVVVPIASKVNLIGMAALAVMMVLTSIDVILRYIFNKPLTGSLELTQFLMVVLVAFGLAYTGVNKGHITVDVLTQRLPKRGRAAVNTGDALFCLGVFALITWRSLVYAQALISGHDASSTLLIPLYPFVLLVALGSALICFVYLYNLLEQLSLVTRGISWPKWSALLLLVAAVVFLFSIPVWNTGIRGAISPNIAGVIGVVLLVVVLFSEMPIGVVMALLGFIGMVYIMGLKPGLTNVGISFYSTASSYSLSVIPLFVLMGLFCFYSGISKGLYDTVYRWIGHLPGGLAMATIGACAGFAAVSGSSVATAATMGTVALPEMRKANYSSALATGCIAAGGCLGILIPPSTILAIYGLLTEQSIGKLFLAGFIPGIIEAIFYIVTIYIICKRDPSMGPAGLRSTWAERISSLKNVWPVLLLFIVVIGGLYMGVFTPTEAAAVGAFGAFVIALALRKLSWKQFKDSLSETSLTTAMVFVILIGAAILGYFLAVARLPSTLSDWVSTLDVNRWLIMTGIIVLYLFLGCIMSSMAMIILTVPIFFPVIMSLGFNPIWFGIIIVKVVEIGQLTPPVGINVFVIQGIAKDVPMYTIFRGIIPFFIADLIEVVLLCLVPSIATILPDLMKA